MPQNCTILCPSDDSKRVVALVGKLIRDRGTVQVSGKTAVWSSIAIETSGASLVLNRLVRVRPGDQFSKLVLGMLTYFRNVKTRRRAVKADVLQRVTDMALTIGVVAEP